MFTKAKGAFEFLLRRLNLHAWVDDDWRTSSLRQHRKTDWSFSNVVRALLDTWALYRDPDWNGELEGIWNTTGFLSTPDAHPVPAGGIPVAVVRTRSRHDHTLILAPNRSTIENTIERDDGIRLTNDNTRFSIREYMFAEDAEIPAEKTAYRVVADNLRMGLETNQGLAFHTGDILQFDGSTDTLFVDDQELARPSFRRAIERGWVVPA